MSADERLPRRRRTTNISSGALTLECEDHRAALSEFLTARGFLREVEAHETPLP
jgi:hypothetical protein